MIAAKSVRFFLRYAADDPLRFAGMLRRRAIERFSTPPAGAVTTRFGEVDYDIDLSIHRLMAKYYFHTHEMFSSASSTGLQPARSSPISARTATGRPMRSRVGRAGEVHAFEPVPHHCCSRRLAELNPDYRGRQQRRRGRAGPAPSDGRGPPRPENFQL